GEAARTVEDEEQGQEDGEAAGGARRGDRQRIHLGQHPLGDGEVHPPEQRRAERRGHAGGGGGGHVSGGGGRAAGGDGPGRAACRREAGAAVRSAQCFTLGSAASMLNFGSFFASWQVAQTPWMMQKEHWSVMP